MRIRMSDETTGICITDDCVGEEPKLYPPAMREMAKNLFTTVKEAIGHAYEGKGVTVPDEVYTERLKICKTCPAFRTEDARCMDCGCFMKAKAAFKVARCPQDKWGKVE
jgi:tRNA(Ile2) C34 agmatinyltransferase TiaS